MFLFLNYLNIIIIDFKYEDINVVIFLLFK